MALLLELEAAHEVVSLWDTEQLESQWARRVRCLAGHRSQPLMMGHHVGTLARKVPAPELSRGHVSWGLWTFDSVRRHRDSVRDQAGRVVPKADDVFTDGDERSRPGR